VVQIVLRLPEIMLEILPRIVPPIVPGGLVYCQGSSGPGLRTGALVVLGILGLLLPASLGTSCGLP